MVIRGARGPPGLDWAWCRKHDNAIVEMGVEVPPFIAAPIRVDALTVLKLGDFNGADAKSLVVGRQIRQPEVAVLAALHGLSHVRR